jgi:hypothetical protein
MVLLLLSCSFSWIQAQENDNGPNFWDNVSIGGGIGLGVGSGYFSVYVAPSAIYNFNEYLSAGPGIQYSYQSGDNFDSSLYGISAIVLANPIPAIQLSTELEQVYVNQNQEFFNGTVSTNFWNTALYLGAGFRAGPATIGLRYNVLFQEDDAIYASAWVPFVRVFF